MMMKGNEMNLIAQNAQTGETRDLGSDFTFESAYEFIAENDSDPFENPWLPGFDLILIDGAEHWVLEADAWAPVE
jgi:hypothetical protein